jgi:hypothetical protein
MPVSYGGWIVIMIGDKVKVRVRVKVMISLKVDISPVRIASET